MTFRVHHYHPCGTGNSGDDLVVRALRQNLVRHLGPCDFVSIPATARGAAKGQSLGLCAENVRRSNLEADLVLVGGSNMLEPRKTRHHDDCNIPLALDGAALEKLNKPLILAGMGSGSSFGSRILSYSSVAKRNLKILFEKATAHAVRDITTVRELAKIGIETRCTGCPVTFLTDRAVTVGDQSRPLLVSFPPTRIRQKWFGSSFLHLAARYLRWLHAEGVEVIVSLHEPVDREPAKALVPSALEIFYTEDVDELIGRVQHARGMVGFRLHAGLLALGLGIPIVPVGVDWRGLGFIETADLHDLAIRPFRVFQGAKLRRITRRLLDGDSSLVQRLNDFKSKMKAENDRFFADLRQTFQPLKKAG